MKFIVTTPADVIVSSHRTWTAAVDAASRITNWNADCPVTVYCRDGGRDWLFSTATRAPVAGSPDAWCVRTDFTVESLPYRYTIGSREYIVASRHLGNDPFVVTDAGHSLDAI